MGAKAVLQLGRLGCSLGGEGEEEERRREGWEWEWEWEWEWGKGGEVPGESQVSEERRESGGLAEVFFRLSKGMTP